MTYPIEPCTPSDFDRVLDIINLASEAYRGVIPDACFHEPYMSESELRREIAAGIRFSGYLENGRLVGVMGIQDVADVTLIRHAYVDPAAQRGGVGAKLLSHLKRQTDRSILIGTWLAATWAITFYRKHGFELVDRERIRPLLKQYWTISEAQIVNSCVLIDTRKPDRPADTIA